MKNEDLKIKKKRDINENFITQYKKATLPLLMLQLLSEKDMYVYEIVQVLSQRSKGIYNISPPYTAIDKFQEQGFVIEGSKVVTDDNRIRIYYKITDDGLAYLKKLKQQYAILNQIVWLNVYGKDISDLPKNNSK